MSILYAPWRSTYIMDPKREKNKNSSNDKCLFCKIIKENQDKRNLVLKRFSNTFVILNIYPYNAGHLLLLPNKHTDRLDKLSPVERIELIEVANQSIKILSDTLKNEGLNLGLNIGKAAGVGIPSHLHIHLLPRWQGDTNFITTLGKTRVLSFDLKKIYSQIKEKFDLLPTE